MASDGNWVSAPAKRRGVVDYVKLKYYHWCLWTGIYMLDTRERAALNSIVLVLLALPLIKDSAGLVAASVGGIAALIVDPLPFGAGIIVGAVAGLIAGGVVLATKAPPASPTTEEVIADA